MEKLKALTPEKLEYYQKVLDSAQTIWDAKAEIDGTMGDDMQLGLALFAYKEMLQHLNTQTQPEVLTEGWISKSEIDTYKETDTIIICSKKLKEESDNDTEIVLQDRRLNIPVKIIRRVE